MAKQFIFHHEILFRKVDIKGTLITKHREKEVVNHVLQGNRQFTNIKEKSMKGRALTTYQMPEPFGVSETLKISGNSHCL